MINLAATTTYSFAALLISVMILVIRILGEKKNNAICRVQKREPLCRKSV